MFDCPSNLEWDFLITKRNNQAVGLIEQPRPSKRLCYLVTEIACRTNSCSTVLRICFGMVADRSFYQTASILLSDQAICSTCHSLWELTDFVLFPAMSGTVFVFVACTQVLFDKKYFNRLLPIQQKSLDRAIFLYNFIREAR